MPVVIAEGEVVVTADGTKVAPMVAKDIEGNQAPIEGAGRKIGGSLFAGLVAFGLVAKTTQWLGVSITAASDLNETTSKSAAIFGANEAAVEKWASRAALNMGLTSSAALDNASSFGNMFTQIGFTGDEAAAASTKVVQMAADLGSFSNLDAADVSERIAGAFRGEYDALQKVIPNISAARVEHEAMIETGKKNAAQLTAQEKAQAVLNIIQTDGKTAMGDFARTSDGFANSSRIATAQIGDMQSTIGTALLPVMKDLLQFLLTYIIPALVTFAGWVSQNTSWLIPLAIGLGIAAAAVWAVNIAMYANPIGLIIAAVVLLIAIIVALVMNWDTVVKFLTDVWQGFVNWFVDVMNGYTAWWQSLWAGLGGFITDTWNGFIGWITDLWGKFLLGLKIIGAALSKWWSDLWLGFGNLVAGAIGFVSDTWAGFVGFLGGIPAAIGNALGGVGAFILNAFKGPLNAVVDMWNGTLGQISLTIPGWVPGIGGQTWSVPKLPHFAQGTLNAPGGWSIVGERGPELVNLGRGSQVHTAAETMAGLGAGSRNITIGQITLDASKFKTLQDLIDTVEALTQVARTGRGPSLGLAPQ
jgi:hypothetical protein